MDKSRKKSAILCACIFMVLGIWMILSVPCLAAETNNDEKQPQIIRVGSFEDTFAYVDQNGVRRDMDTSSCIPIIAMTANTFAEDGQAALNAGMDDHVAKPVDMSILISIIQKYIER